MKAYAGFCFAAVAIAATVFAGCTSVKTSPNFNSLPLDREREAPAAHINVSMDGLYFLGFLCHLGLPE